MEKMEYIKHLKKLIKKYHPDLCDNKNLESMYNEIAKKSNSILNELKTNEFNNLIKNYTNILEINDSITNVKDQDYEYYKLGIKYGNL
jgi:flagellar biosynthesis component FlhA